MVDDKDLTSQALAAIGLTEDEIDIYFATARRNIISIGEISNISKASNEVAQKVVEKLLEKGLFKEIGGVTPYYKAVAPYPALVNQLGIINDIIIDFQEKAPLELEGSFSEIEKKLGENLKFKEFNEALNDLRESTSSHMDNQKDKVNIIALKIEAIKKINDIVGNLKDNNKSLIDSQINDISEQFNVVNEKLSSSLSTRIEEFNSQFKELNKSTNQKLRELVKTLESNIPKMKDATSQSLDNLQIGPVKNTVIQVINNLMKRWVDDIVGDLVITTREVQGRSIEGLEEVTTSLRNQLETNKKVIDEALEITTQNINSNLILKIDNSMGTTINEINEIIESTVPIREELNEFLTEITENLNVNISRAGENISEISENISRKSADNLKKVLENISNKIEISTNTINEFWEQAKRVTLEEETQEGTTEGKQLKISSAIFKSFDNLISKIEKMDGNDIFASLNEIKEAIYESVGYTPIVREINQVNTPFKRRRKPVDQFEKKELVNQINLWRKRLLN